MFADNIAAPYTAPENTTGGHVSGRLSVYPEGYSRFTDAAYDAIGVDRDRVNAVSLYTAPNHIGIRLHSVTDAETARDIDGVIVGPLPDHGVQKQADGRFPIDCVLRDVFGVDASVIDTSVTVRARWDHANSIWKVPVGRLAAAMDIDGVSP